MDAVVAKHLSFFESHRYTSPYHAPDGLVLAIVEPRRHRFLRFVLYNALYYVPVPIVVFTSNINKEWVLDLLGPCQYAQVVCVCESNLTREGYNELVSSPEFYSYFAGFSHCLLFQTDSYMRKPLDPSFMQYDYVGAPWKWVHHDPHGGNGGLSLRRIQTMVSIARAAKRPCGLNEDVFFSEFLRKDYTAYLPSTVVASSFSVESVHHPDPFGVHCGWKYFPNDQSLAKLHY